jgi:hypothetical protein
MYAFFTKIRSQIPHLDQIWIQMLMYCAFKHFQLDMFQHLGSRLIRINMTHNITQYEDFLLFTIIARDQWGHSGLSLHHAVKHGIYLIKSGVLVAWMLTSNRTTDTISFFVHWVQDRSLAIVLSVIITDCDQAQIHTLKIVYPASWILLCKWHMLHAT